MNVTSETEATDPIDELLTAYLDNELHDHDRAEVEARLASDAKFRQRLHKLQKAWDALDFLPKPSAEPTFAETTIGMAAAMTRDDGIRAESDAKRWDTLKLGILIGGGLLSFLTLFAITSSVRRAMVARQLQDLPVIEKLDELRGLGSVEFLKQLRADKIIEEKPNAGAKP